MKGGISRRAILGTLPVVLRNAFAVTGKNPKPLPKVGEFTRLLDPSTEATLVRLTALSSVAEMPRPSGRFVSSRSRFLVFSSNRSGSFEPYRLDLHSGSLEKLATCRSLHVRSLSLDRSEKSLFFLDDGQVKTVSLTGKHEQVVAERVDQFILGATDRDLVVLRGGSVERADGTKIGVTAETLLSLDPAAQQCLFVRQAGGHPELCLLHLESGQSSTVVSDDFSFPYWSPDGASLVFLHNEGPGTRILQMDLATRTTQAVSTTSPMACFSPNADGSVFTASLRSKAQPFVMLMLRSPKREITLCEHHSSDPAAVTPVFSPDSRRVYFQSNREGNNAIYSVDVSSLVEPTPVEEG